jgi:hypothetical protein
MTTYQSSHATDESAHPEGQVRLIHGWHGYEDPRIHDFLAQHPEQEAEASRLSPSTAQARRSVQCAPVMRQCAPHSGGCVRLSAVSANLVGGSLRAA